MHKPTETLSTRVQTKGDREEDEEKKNDKTEFVLRQQQASEKETEMKKDLVWEASRFTRRI